MVMYFSLFNLNRSLRGENIIVYNMAKKVFGFEQIIEKCKTKTGNNDKTFNGCKHFWNKLVHNFKLY